MADTDDLEALEVAARLERRPDHRLLLLCAQQGHTPVERASSLITFDDPSGLRGQMEVCSRCGTLYFDGTIDESG